MRHYTLRGADSPSKPALLFEIKIDLQDARSGYRDSDYAFFKGSWPLDEEIVWTRDMVTRIPSDQLMEIPPPSQPPWPASGDEKITRFLVSHYGPKVWKNYELDLYSRPGESEAEFVNRCREELEEERSQAMKKLREVFLHRFFELRQRLVKAIEGSQEGEDLKRRELSLLGSLFHQAREDLSRWFLIDDDQWLSRHEASVELPSHLELRDRLADLRGEIADHYRQTCSLFEERATRVESYPVSVGPSAIEIMSRSIFWE
ncbi:MAG: hypothetical protein ACE5JX_10545 [Acidobacteriota bacterium]